ncbi:hypothetical protein A9W95_24430 [Mycobacterium sp. 1423905.2]|nr:hypothetical protein A9W95_24430 [Mycobacterium sp. 1423905.2]
MDLVERTFADLRVADIAGDYSFAQWGQVSWQRRPMLQSSNAVSIISKGADHMPADESGRTGY